MISFSTFLGMLAQNPFLAVTIALVLGTIFVNGATDAANAIAEAVGTPTLSLWGPTSPAIYGPLTSGHTFIESPYPCRACCRTHCKKKNNACMAAIAPADVAEKLSEMLGRC